MGLEKQRKGHVEMKDPFAVSYLRDLAWPFWFVLSSMFAFVVSLVFFDVEITRRGRGGAEIKSVSGRYKLTERPADGNKRRLIVTKSRRV